MWAGPVLGGRGEPVAFPRGGNPRGEHGEGAEEGGLPRIGNRPSGGISRGSGMGGEAGSCCCGELLGRIAREAQNDQAEQRDGAIPASGMCRVRSSPATCRTGARAEPGGARPDGARFGGRRPSSISSLAVRSRRAPGINRRVAPSPGSVQRHPLFDLALAVRDWPLPGPCARPHVMKATERRPWHGSGRRELRSSVRAR